MQQFKILFITNHGKVYLKYEVNEALLDVLLRNKIPWSAVSLYLSKEGNTPILYTGLERKIESFSHDEELIVYLNRNINPFTTQLNKLNLVESDEGEASTEYFYQNYDNKNGMVKNYLKRFTPEECKQVVAANVHSFIEKYIEPKSKIVVGISGGGDSNALLHGLTTFNKFKIEIHPLIIKGCIDWDKGVPRAQELCAKYNIPLSIMEEQEVKELINMPEQKEDLVTRFENIFPGDDFEFMGTLLIGLALTKEADRIGTKFICTGLNLEDLLAGSIYTLINSKPLKQLPTRDIGEKKLLFPLWLSPKKIIDGCFPVYSKQNYEARYPCFSLGRTLYYQIANTIQSSYPGMAEKLLKGFSNYGDKFQTNQTFDEDLGFWIEENIPLNIRNQFIKLRER